MPPAFVPFFEKPSSSEPLVQAPQFNQYKLSKVTVSQSHAAPHSDKTDLSTKLLGDLKNAITMSLPEEAVHQILSDLERQRAPEVVSDLEAGAENPAGESQKPCVHLEKDGDKITNIIVECECGQVIELDCVY